jgi:lipopolysaccharide biosynthesis glycosyltransferase
MNNKLNIYIGYDSSEYEAYEVCAKSILKYSTKQLEIKPLILKDLIQSGIYTREKDPLSSTEFTFSRFLVPYLNEYKGMALYCDSDFLFLDDVSKLFDLFDSKKALQCCKHDYTPKNETKMNGAIQYLYPRKNWSSLMLFNCEHPSNLILDNHLVNTHSGQYLHRFNWLMDYEIGSIPIEWNWLVNWYKEPTDGYPKALHFTEGCPCHENYRYCEYNQLWYAIRDE